MNTDMKALKALVASNKAALENMRNSPYVCKIRTPKGLVGTVRANERAIESMGEKGVQLIHVRYNPFTMEG